MIKSRKLQLVVMVLISACTCGLILGAEPNETKVGLKFEIGTDEKAWLISSRTDEIGQGPINPTHLAHFYINERQKCPTLPGSRWIKSILESSAGQSMSRKQKSFVKTGREDFLRLGIFNELGPMKKGFYYFRLFAVSEDDAKKMTQATIEVLTNKANAKLQKLQTERQELQEKIAEIKKQISKMEAEIKNAQPNLDRLKKEIQYLHSGKAEEAISEFNKMLNTLKIELSGIRSRLQTIEIYKAKLGKEISGEHRFKLEQMFIEQMIELKAGEARKNTVIDLRNEARSFYNLDRKLDKLKSTKYNLGNDLTRLEPVLGQIEERLANPTPDMLPPKVYQNKVTIYPVTIYPVRAGE